MNKKPGLLIAVALFAIIILATSFHMNLGDRPPLDLPQGVNPADVLYVCPVTNETWQGISSTLHLLDRYASVFFAFIGIVLSFSWGWAIYQNLLKDKFSEDAYKNPWALTKGFFWLIVIFTLLMATPNYYREVRVSQSNEQWVLCDSVSKDARAVYYKAVTLK